MKPQVITVLKSFRTNQCDVVVMDLNTTAFGRKIYCIRTDRISNGKVIVRFGNAEQMNSIIGAYRPRVGFRIREETE